MAIPVFQSLKNSLLLPTPNGSGVNVYEGEYVKGSYYTFFETIGFLLDVTDQNIDDSLIKFTYPETPGQTNGNTPIGTITSVTAGPGLTGGGTEGDIDIGLAAGGITSAMISSGQVVKILNTFTDTVTITAGYGIDVNNSLNNIEIVNTYPGLMSAVGTLPLTLELGEGFQSITGSIAITPTNDGGAIAKQTVLPVDYQVGHIGLQGNFYSYDGKIRLNSSYDSTVVSDNAARIISFYEDTSRYQLAFINGSGIGLGYSYSNGLNLPLVTSIDNSGLLQTITATIYGNFSVDSQGEEDHIFHVENSALVATSHISLFSTTYIYKTVNLAEEASIEGTVETKPLINLLNSSTTIPAIKVSNEDNANAALVFQTKNNSNVTTSKLDTDGNLTVNSLTANTLRYKYTYIDTAQTYNVLTNGPQVIIANCASGAVIVQLPDLTAEFETETITVTVKKIDATSNSLSVVPANGHYIDGSGSTINLTTKNSSLTLVGTLINNVRHWWKVSEI